MGNKPKVRVQVLVLASTFPRWDGDTEPRFVYELASSMPADFGITVLAPHYHKAKMFEMMGRLKVVRFPYFIPRFQRLCYDGGIHENIKRNFLARLQVLLLPPLELVWIFLLMLKNRRSLIHAHWILPHGFLAVIVKKFFGVPVVISAHAGDVFPLKKPFFRLAARWALKCADAVTANSTATRNAIGGVVDVPVSVIPMGVDLKLFSSSSASAAAAIRKRYGVGKSGKMLLFVGRLAEKKGVTYLISAMKAVAKAFPNCKLVIVGDGPERKSLQQQSQQLDLSDNVVFAGSVPNNELPAYYKAADAFVLPSIVARSGDTEGLGVVLLEAVAAGCPVVASNVGGIPDVIINGKTGLLVEQKNPQQLAAAITNLLSSSQLKKRLVAAARKHVAKGYSWEAVAEQFSKLISQLL